MLCAPASTAAVLLPSLCKGRWHTECTEGLSVGVSTVFQAAEQIENKN